MSQLQPISQMQSTGSLPALIDRAVSALSGAKTAAEVLEARGMADLAYDAAKRAARLLQAQQAHESVVGAAHRAQAEALKIAARAQERLADEYDAAQERGEVAKHSPGRPKSVPDQNDLPATAADIGLSRKDIHEARMIRDAEAASPGIVSETVDAAIAAGEEPTRAKVRRAVAEKVRTRKPANDLDEASAAAAPVGARVMIPGGKSPEVAMRAAMAVEDDQRLAPTEAAERAGIAINSYRLMRDIVLLADKTDLSPRDSETAKSALALLNEHRQIRPAHEMVKPIIARVWGESSFRKGMGTRAEKEAKRVANFEHAYGAIIQACTGSAKVDVPHLGADRAAEIVDELKQAIKTLQAFCRRIEELRA